MIPILLVMAALVLFVMSGLGVPDAPRFRMGWWGLACCALAWLFLVYPTLHLS